MSDKLDEIVKTIVSEDAADGYQDNDLLVLLLLKKILSQDGVDTENQLNITPDQEQSLISV